MSLIDDIYSGDVYPAEQVNPVSDAFREHSRKAEDLYGRLNTSLDEEQRGLLDGYRYESAAAADLCDLEFYRAGVQFGVRLILEALGWRNEAPDIHK